MIFVILYASTVHIDQHISFDSSRTSSMSVSTVLRLLPLLAALRHEQKTLALTDMTNPEEKNVTTEVGGGIDWDFASGCCLVQRQRRKA